MRLLGFGTSFPPPSINHAMPESSKSCELNRKPHVTYTTKSVEELCASLKTGGIPDKFCEDFKGKVAKFCLVCSNFSSYGIAGYFRGVLIFVIFVVKQYGTKFSTHENFRSTSKQVLKSMCGAMLL